MTCSIVSLPYPYPYPYRRFALCVAIAACIPSASCFTGPMMPAASPALSTVPKPRMQALNRGKEQRRLLTGIASASQPEGSVVVQNCLDSGPGSLRDAMASATEPVSIDLSQLPCSVITLTTGALTDSPSASLVVISAPYQLDGSGVPSPSITIDAGGSNRAFEHNGSGDLALYGLKITNGLSIGVGAQGGCIQSKASLLLAGDVIVACTALASGDSTARGGAMYSATSTILVSSVVSGNLAKSAIGYSYGGAIYSSGSLLVQLSTIDSNQAGGMGEGGGAFAHGVSSIQTSTFANNSARYDGAFTILADGASGSTIIDSTIAMNTASGMVGGIEVDSPLEIDNSTIAFNTGTVAKRSGGIYVVDNVPLTLNSTIIANNSEAGRSSDVGGLHAVLGSHNLIVAHDVTIPPDTILDDPVLSPLQNNGGPTQTMALLASSPAIDAGSVTVLQKFDQRQTGFPRTSGAATDIGAYELQIVDSVFVDGFDG